MKRLQNFVSFLALSLILLSCNPLDKKYDKEKYAEIMAKNADSTSQSAFNRATVENEINDVRNEDFTYQELIDQGRALQRKDLPNKNVAR
ncbi:hypothetical protein [Larkinella terrae]|uniref:Uncharacterized protein n=1 Tax=Larkinella terrae TaxID=2025311 RepID=A0A7K0EL63_9BACT|nr:hypothetical protein [Larkinella terrae]MRS62515.1 hypothetical protein [Larkinella terrae]